MKLDVRRAARAERKRQSINYTSGEDEKKEAQKWPAGVVWRKKIKWISFHNLPMTLKSLINSFFISNFFMFKFYDDFSLFFFSGDFLPSVGRRRWIRWNTKLKTNSGNNSKHLQVKTVFFASSPSSHRVTKLSNGDGDLWWFLRWWRPFVLFFSTSQPKKKLWANVVTSDVGGGVEGMN